MIYNTKRSYLTVEITVVNDSKVVTINSTIHVNKKRVLGVSYSKEFTDWDILNDEHVRRELYRYY